LLSGWQAKPENGILRILASLREAQAVLAKLASEILRDYTDIKPMWPPAVEVMEARNL
jgi:hypothetical protein